MSSPRLYELTEGNLYAPPYYFDEKILALKAAGNIDTDGPNPQPPDQAGVDCVGFINNVWRLGTRAGTSITNQEILPIEFNELKRGDILMKFGQYPQAGDPDKAHDITGNHVILFKEFVFDEPGIPKIKVYESSKNYRKVTESIWKVIGDPVPYIDLRYPDSPTHIVKLERVKVNLDGVWEDSHYFVQNGYIPRTLIQPRDIVIVIDRSGSMSQENRIAQAKEAAKLLIDAMRPGDRIGIVSFAGTAAQIYPPPGEDLTYGEIEQNAYNYVKNDAKNAVTNISLGSDGTTIGGGLHLGQQLLDTSDGENRTQVMILLSDGEEISAPFWDAVKDEITVPVHTISIGYTYPLMSEIANFTHGGYWGATSGYWVNYIIQQIAPETYRDDIIREVKRQVSSGGTTEETVLVDSTVGSVTFSIAWPGSDLDLTLVQPDGSVINPATAESDPDIEFVLGATYEYYKIRYPQKGQWTVRVFGASTSGPEEDFSMVASAADAMILDVQTDKEEYIVGNQIKITATIEDSILDTPLAPEYIHGAVMQVAVTNPLNDQSSFELYDNGLHGDGEQDDGVYANTFSDPLIEGNYTFDLEITGNAIRDGGPFTRETSLAIQVIDPPTVESINRVSGSPTNYYNVDYTVTFSESVTGVDSTDFALTTSGISGAAISAVSGSGSVYTVTVNTGSGNGTIRLDVVDNDTIKDANSNRLGGLGAGNGSFTTGEAYTIDKTAISTIVTKPEDTNDGLCDSDCSLREAIATAAPNTAIAFDVSLSGETIHLFSTLTLSRNITLNGSALAVPITISGDTNDDGVGDIRVLSINSGVVAFLDSMTISKGYISDSGGGIRNLGGTVYIHNSTVSSNTAFYGGGVYSTGQVIVYGSTFWGNSASAGAGGGIYVNGSMLTITNSTLSGNSSSARGGGVNQIGGTLTITNSTLSGNSAFIEGGSIFINNGNLNYANTIVANSTFGGDCVRKNGSIGTNSRNLVEDGSCSAELTGDPYLSSLVNNGGTTQTMELLNGSPAIDAGDDSICASIYFDQRGIARPQGPHCDIGAFEVVQVMNSFPITPVLDDFNRANGSIGSNWSGNTFGYTVSSNKLNVDYSGSNSDIYWSSEPFGADQEAYVTLTHVDISMGEQNLLLKSQSNNTWGDGILEVLYNPTGQRVQVWTYEWPAGWVQHGADIPVTFVDGDQFGARSLADGTVEVYRNGELLATRDITAWSHYADGGYIGLWFIGAEDAVLDEFGGGTISVGMQSMSMATIVESQSAETSLTPEQLNVTLTNANIFWQGVPIGSNQKAYVTFAQLYKIANVFSKPQSNGAWGEGIVQVLYDVAGSRIQVWMYDTQKGWAQYGADIPVKFAEGDKFSVRVLANGTVEIQRNGKLLAKRDVTP